jgi:hypothetical protein
LVSYSAKDLPGTSGGRDLVTKAVLEFRNTEALLAFLDASGVHASFVLEAAPSVTGNLLRLVLLSAAKSGGNATETTDADLLSLLREISGGYEIKISLTAPKNASLTVTPDVQAAQMITRGKKVSFSIGTGDLLSLDEGLELEIGW